MALKWRWAYLSELSSVEDSKDRGKVCVFSVSAPGMHVHLLILKGVKQQPVKVRSTLQKQLRFPGVCSR